MNRWSASAAWVAAVIGTWPTLVPSVMSAGSWGAVAVAGPLFLVGAAAFWDTARLEPSFRQRRVSDEAHQAERGRP